MFKIAIVGRPNVGKSALFNRICQKRVAIVDATVGVTRDRLYADAEYLGRPFQVIDTAGIDPHSTLPFREAVRSQTLVAIQEADCLILVVDGVVGVTALDEGVAQLVLQSGKPALLAVNKVDHLGQQDRIHDFHGLGIRRLMAVSALHGFQIAELLELALAEAGAHEELPKPCPMQIAIVGKPNVGKSTLVNALLQEVRCIVSPQAGTTRDSIDTELVLAHRTLTLIDTAGIRRKGSSREAVDALSSLRTERAISRSEICVVVLDAQEGVRIQERRLIHQIESEGKGCLLLFNKWDLVKGFRMEHCLHSLREHSLFLSHCPTLFISAQRGRNLDKILPLIEQIHQQRALRISTGQLNRFLAQAMERNHPPMIQGKRLRIYYLTQIKTEPPRFVLFVNDPALMSDTYRHYLINQLRAAHGFQGVPLLFSLRGKQKTRGHGGGSNL